MKKIMKKINDDQMLLEVNKKVYAIKAITQTAYRFIDKCVIHIDSISEDVIGIYFRAKPETDLSLENITSDFCNELIDQQVRIHVEKSCGKIRDEIVRKAFSSIDH